MPSLVTRMRRLWLDTASTVLEASSHVLTNTNSSSASVGY